MWKGKFGVRKYNNYSEELRRKNNKTLKAVVGLALGALGLSYAAVPLYQAFCAATGFAGTPKILTEDDIPEASKYQHLPPVRVRFNGVTSPLLNWEFEPEQQFIDLRPGETMLAFFKAKNMSDKPIIGVSTYNVVPLNV